MKKRYQVTLTEDRVKRFQALSEKLNMPKSAMSSMLDDLLLQTVTSMEKFVKRGKFSLADLFSVLAEQLEEEGENHADDGGSAPPAKKREAKKKG